MPDHHLYRSRDDRMLAGVAGGLADLWGADPSLVRILWALLMIFTGGIALVVYIVMAIVVPEEGNELREPRQTPEGGPPVAGAGADAAAVSPDAAAAPAGTPAARYWEPSRRDARADARAARRAARRQRGSTAAPAVIGIFLVMLGG